jgi:hypothetical protein
MKRIAFLLLAVVTVGGDSSPIYGVKIPVGYRAWKVIAVAQLIDTRQGRPVARSTRQRNSDQGL